jgi:putative tricarboxylic transport membrane protein
MGVLGGLGYVLLRVGIPIPPIVLGLVLGGLLEAQYRTALTLSGGSFDIFYQSPIAGFFFLLTLSIIGWQVYATLRNRRRPTRDPAG